jgi:hypothetical protein
LTAQLTDTLAFEGESYRMYSTPLSDYLTMSGLLFAWYCGAGFCLFACLMLARLRDKRAERLSKIDRAFALQQAHGWLPRPSNWCGLALVTRLVLKIAKMNPGLLRTLVNVRRHRAPL